MSRSSCQRFDAILQDGMLERLTFIETPHDDEPVDDRSHFHRSRVRAALQVSGTTSR